MTMGTTLGAKAEDQISSLQLPAGMLQMIVLNTALVLSLSQFRDVAKRYYHRTDCVLNTLWDENKREKSWLECFLRCHIPRMVQSSENKF